MEIIKIWNVYLLNLVKKKYKLVVINSCKLYFFLKNNIDVDKKKVIKYFVIFMDINYCGNSCVNYLIVLVKVYLLF